MLLLVGVEHLLGGGLVWVVVRGSWWFGSPLSEVRGEDSSLSGIYEISLLTLGGWLSLLVSASVPLELLVSWGGMGLVGLRLVVRAMVMAHHGGLLGVSVAQIVHFGPMTTHFGQTAARPDFQVARPGPSCDPFRYSGVPSRALWWPVPDHLVARFGPSCDPFRYFGVTLQPVPFQTSTHFWANI